MLVAKFGGSSLADAKQFVKVKSILLADGDRRYVVPSAPGKRGPEDDKITDLLIACHTAAQSGKPFLHILERIQARYTDIAQELGISMPLADEFATIAKAISEGASLSYAASRGEYLNGMLLAAYIDYPFVDAARVIRFDREGKLLEEETNRLLSDTLHSLPRAVIPGFYGAEEDGTIHTFTRGGSDISGALVARAVNADVYENWTDVTGFRMADPRIVPDALSIASMTYRELRELSYMGASVLHDEAVFPVRRAGIPTNIRNTNDPLHPGTMIHAAAPMAPGHVITGIAGKKGFSIVSVEKDMMNAELGFGRRVLASALSICPPASTPCAWLLRKRPWPRTRKRCCAGSGNWCSLIRLPFTNIWPSSPPWAAAWCAISARQRGCFPPSRPRAFPSAPLIRVPVS